MGGRGQRGVTENVGHLRADFVGLEGEVTLGFPVKVTEGRRDKEQKQEQSCGMTLRLRYTSLDSSKELPQRAESRLRIPHSASRSAFSFPGCA